MAKTLLITTVAVFFILVTSGLIVSKFRKSRKRKRNRFSFQKFKDIDDKNLRNKLGKNAHQIVYKYYDKEKILNNFLKDIEI